MRRCFHALWLEYHASKNLTRDKSVEKLNLKGWKRDFFSLRTKKEFHIKVEGPKIWFKPLTYQDGAYSARSYFSNSREENSTQTAETLTLVHPDTTFQPTVTVITSATSVTALYLPPLQMNLLTSLPRLSLIDCNNPSVKIRDNKRVNS